MSVIEVLEYLDEEGRSPFGGWLQALEDVVGRAKIVVALNRIAAGNFGDCKSVGDGVLERRIDFGPGYRIYFGREGERLVILLGGGSKRRQARDIADAKERWADYRKRKRRETNRDAVDP